MSTPATPNRVMYVNQYGENFTPLRNNETECTCFKADRTFAAILIPIEEYRKAEGTPQLSDGVKKQSVPASQPSQGATRTCFWPSGCSDSRRCSAFGGCVAKAQNLSARLAREKPAKMDAAKAAAYLSGDPQVEVEVLRLVKADLERELTTQAALARRLAEVLGNVQEVLSDTSRVRVLTGSEELCRRHVEAALSSTKGQT